MDEPINVGDLVAIIRWPCCGKWLGSLFRVAFFEGGHTEMRCNHCSKTYPAIGVVGAFGGRTPQDIAAPTEWLKRIPPPEELGIVDEKEEITA